MAKRITLQVYIDNLNAGVSKDEIIKAAIAAGVNEVTAKKNLEKAKAAIVAGVTPEDEELEEQKDNENESNSDENESVSDGEQKKVSANDENSKQNDNFEEETPEETLESAELTLEEKTNQLLTTLELVFTYANELCELRRKNKLSDIGIANVSREITQLIKVTKRYVES